MNPPNSDDKLQILQQTADWLAINKPAGVGMHSEDSAGIVVQASRQLNQPLWPVHRLDKVTSGILLLAKNKESAARLSALFADHGIQKYYLARTTQKPKKKQGWIKGDMAKSRNGSWKLLHSRNNPAITRFISHFDHHRQHRLFLLMPHTGRTHQLRVAMKSLSSPIDGDQRYGGSAAERTYLHAYGLHFDDNGQQVRLQCQPDNGNWGEICPDWCAPEQCFSQR